MTRTVVGKRFQVRRARAASTAVSLFELMVVFVIAAILTALFVYFSGHFIVTTRVSRVKEEHRVLARALQNYEADYGVFPETQPGLHALYGPIAYMVRVPPDPFSDHESEEYAYVSSPGEGYRWLIVSRGPDGDSDLLTVLKRSRQKGALMLSNSADDPNTLSLPTKQLKTLLLLSAYDPTNGLVSSGDIVTATR